MRRKTPVILQLSDTECGIASLAMIFAYYKLSIPIEELRDQCGVSRDGCKAETLISVANKYGFQCDAYSVDVEALKHLTAPVIAFWNFNHYVVIKRVAKNKVIINDPAHGAISVTLDEFDRAFTGVILDLKPIVKIINKKSDKDTLKIIKQWLTGTRLFICILLFFLLAASISPYLNSMLYSIFVDHCILAYNKDLIPSLVLLTVFTYIIYIVATYLYKRILFAACIKAGSLHTSHFIHHILRLPLLFYSLRQRSEIIAITSRAETIINLLFRNTISTAASLFSLIICLIVMLKIDVYLSLASLFITLACITIISSLSSIKLEHEKTGIHTAAKLNAHLMSFIKNIETVKACSLANNIIEKWWALFCKNIIANHKVSYVNATSSVLIKSCHLLQIHTILLIGTLRLLSNAISIGNLLAYYTINVIFYSNFAILFKAYNDFQSSRVQHIRVNDINKYKSVALLPDTREDRLISTDKFAVTCQNVKFFYNINTQAVLNNISFSITHGEHITFVGATGSGKSTLGKLLCALYQPHSGNISLFGKNLATYSSLELSRVCAYVSQDVVLFTGTLLDNLTHSKPDINLETIYSAIQIACLDNLVAERGLHAKVEQGGSNFSGGEKQRIDIARALLQNTPILILDEATSSLDNDTELKLISNLRMLNKTIIFIAHRLSSIQHCRQIYVLNNGQIIERGTHSELLTYKKHYYGLTQQDTVKNEIYFNASC